MTKLRKIVSTFILLIGILINFSCRKNISCENCNGTNPVGTNKVPVAIAGTDQAIHLPMDSVLLNGSASYDPDGSITSFEWRMVAGPIAPLIVTSSAAITKVKNLLQGYYDFELRVTDNAGLIAKDTIKVTVNGPMVPNIPPVANAGRDTSFISSGCDLSTVLINLNGSGSFDTDGTIVSYFWGGPGVIANPTMANTTVSGLTAGTNQFILTVVDNHFATSKDTVQVTISMEGRPIVPVTLTPINTISSRIFVTIGAVGNKILFAGGFDGNESMDDVNIYDIGTNAWTTARLSQKRYGMAVTSCGTKIFFAGGYYTDGTVAYLCKRIDIYDASTNAWSIDSLSYTTSGLVAATVGNKVFFAGGSTENWTVNFYNRVDIFDLGTSTWSSATLSEARGFLSAVTVNDKIYFAGGLKNGGGVSNKIDIYDNSTLSWTTSTLQEGKACLAGFTFNNRIYWAGGVSSNNPWTLSTQVEIKDVFTNVSFPGCLYQPQSWWWQQPVAEMNNKIVFFNNSPDTTDQTSKIDIYDPATNTWKIGLLNLFVTGASIISINNTIYVAGGFYNGNYSNQIWKLNF